MGWDQGERISESTSTLTLLNPNYFTITLNMQRDHLLELLQAVLVRLDLLLKLLDGCAHLAAPLVLHLAGQLRGLQAPRAWP